MTSNKASAIARPCEAGGFAAAMSRAKHVAPNCRFLRRRARKRSTTSCTSAGLIAIGMAYTIPRETGIAQRGRTFVLARRLRHWCKHVLVG